MTRLDLTHTRSGDLTLWLVSPQGTRVRLVDRAGGTGANFTATVFDDAAATPVASGTVPFTGSLRPGVAGDALSRSGGSGETRTDRARVHPRRRRHLQPPEICGRSSAHGIGGRVPFPRRHDGRREQLLPHASRESHSR